MMFSPPEFGIWCTVVDLRLRELSGRPLAAAPVTEDELRLWWSWRDHAIPARVVAQALSTKMPEVKATFKECFGSTRVREIQLALIGKVAV